MYTIGDLIKYMGSKINLLEYLKFQEIIVPGKVSEFWA